MGREVSLRKGEGLQLGSSFSESITRRIKVDEESSEKRKKWKGLGGKGGRESWKVFQVEAAHVHSSIVWYLVYPARRSLSVVLIELVGEMKMD